MSKNIMLIIEYDGSNYHGWQMQKNSISVQEVLSKAIKKLTGEDIIPVGAGRTDAGVHALGQVANFKTESGILPHKFAVALNSILPGDITIRESREVNAGFNARFSAKSKHYRYIIFNRQQPSALMFKHAWHVPVPLNIDVMNKAAKYLLGRHTFKAFCASGHSLKSFDRTIFHSEWSKKEDLLVYDIKGDGFLYNMVRIIAGTMVDIGKGSLEPGIITEALKTGNRKILGQTAPPDGLYLMEVYYDYFPCFEDNENK
jgi:tRNA pseudouridine38-40 synthase